MLKHVSIFISFMAIIISFTQCGKKDFTGRSGFFAYYTDNNQTDEITGPFPDIVVNIDEKKQIIFSRNTSYLPYLSSNLVAFPFPEVITRSGDGSELNPDKNNIYSYVRIISQSPEEILVHWRYMPKWIMLILLVLPMSISPSILMEESNVKSGLVRKI